MDGQNMKFYDFILTDIDSAFLGWIKKVVQEKEEADTIFSQDAKE